MGNAMDPPVTVTVTRQVKPGCEAQFEALVSEVAQAAHAFPGHLGTTVFRPSGDNHDYRVIYKFDCMSHFHQWQISDIRATKYRQMDLLLSQPLQMQVLTGLETWFDMPGYQCPLVPPPRYKMAIVSWLAIYPLVILILESLNFILIHLPIPVKAALITLICIPTMTYVLMPRMTRVFSKWLYPTVLNERIQKTD